MDFVAGIDPINANGMIVHEIKFPNVSIARNISNVYLRIVMGKDFVQVGRENVRDVFIESCVVLLIAIKKDIIRSLVIMERIIMKNGVVPNIMLL
jgi:hypothetical protein